MRRPILGILTAGKGPVPGNREMFRFVQQACREAGLTAYVFTPDQVNWSRGVVRGYRYVGGRWRAGNFPLPQVVYNRVPNRQLEASAAVKQVKRRLLTRGIPYYNARFLNKYDLYRMLTKEAAIRPHLPWTNLVRRRDDIKAALKQFGRVYLKPRHAFAGQGIMTVELRGNDWELRYRQGNANRVIRGSALGELWSRLERRMGKQSYIVQQAIPLARYRGRTFDIRLLAQKNGAGQWQVTGMGVRVASKGGITTHVPNGGYIASAADVLPAVFGAEADRVREKVALLAMQIAPAVEKGYGGLFGEMSMDIGLDNNGHPWFFEANAKPMRFDEPGIRRKGLQTMTAYVRYLAREAGERG
ncbi:MAG: YheC/YheD family protein [Firmicutes bacterium]|nr:YheC/YheD family protein [Bacillota bacterium]